ncbi:hypothetical protein B5F83_05165 [Muribaculum sp. An289]|nr:hypothetical protein B5F83_05165 [Muribaculum sp. An289]OUO43198.1 hypothetical protein B5F81_05400 [Muribaculum sp. An287]
MTDTPARANANILKTLFIIKSYSLKIIIIMYFHRSTGKRIQKSSYKYNKLFLIFQKVLWETFGYIF